MAGEAKLTTPNCGLILCRLKTQKNCCRAYWGTIPSLHPLKQLLIDAHRGQSVLLRGERPNAGGNQSRSKASGAFYRVAKSVENIQVPATVQAVLAARIDRLPAEDKRLLQSGAVIGKDVPFVLLKAIADLSEEDLCRSLARLQTGEFLYETSLFPEPEYTFKHALTHEVAYGSLLQDRRRTLHARIVEAIEKLYADRLAEHVELLAHHAFRGELWGKTVTYAREAGTKAFMRSANADAVAYFTRGLEVVETLPASAERERKELDLLLALGPALQSTKGFGAPEIEPVYTRARELCRQVGETSQLLPVLWGLWLLFLQRGDLQTARELGTQLFSLAQQVQDPALLLQAHHALWATSFWFGELALARAHSEHGIALYDSQRHRSLAFRYGGHDPGVCCRDFGALALWLLGYPDQALKLSHDALTLAQKLSHPLSLAEALGYAAWLHEFRSEREAVRERTEALLALTNEHGFPYWLAQGTILHGWALAEQGLMVEEGIAQMRQGLLAYRTTGAELSRPHYLVLLAKIYGKVQQAEEGLIVLSEALAWAHKNGGWYYQAELHRLNGEFHGGRSKSAEYVHLSARNAFGSHRDRTANSAKSLELRAAMSLSRLWQRQGKQVEASKTAG